MNYLAHAFLSSDNADALRGAILGDFVKGPLGSEYPPTLRAAIELHRALDRYTDRHPIPAASCALMSAARRRFAPILVDVFYDHFLARHWHDFSDVPLPQFARTVYDALLTAPTELPARLQWVAPRMAADDWLSSYVEVENVEAALNGIARRLARYRRAAVLAEAIEELENNYTALDGHFREFFPQAVAYAADVRTRDAA